MTPLIRIRNLSKSYQRGGQPIPVLLDIQLDVMAGEFVALLGPSGSGKSTLLNLIAGIDQPSSGTIEIGGVDIATLGEGGLADWRAANVGFIFQFYNLMPVLTAFENVELPLLLTGLSSRERHERVAAVMDMVGLTEPRAPAPMCTMASTGRARSSRVSEDSRGRSRVPRSTRCSGADVSTEPPNE